MMQHKHVLLTGGHLRGNLVAWYCIETVCNMSSTKNIPLPFIDFVLRDDICLSFRSSRKSLKCLKLDKEMFLFGCLLSIFVFELRSDSSRLKLLLASLAHASSRGILFCFSLCLGFTCRKHVIVFISCWQVTIPVFSC